jgi:hypothetical protein
MIDPFQLVPYAEELSAKADIMRNKLANIDRELDKAKNINASNARVMDKLREIAQKDIKRVDIKVYYGDKNEYTFTISDENTMNRLMVEIKKWTVHATKTTMAHMRRLTRRKTFRV